MIFFLFQPRLEFILWFYVVYVMVDVVKLIWNDEISMDIQVRIELNVEIYTSSQRKLEK